MEPNLPFRRNILKDIKLHDLVEIEVPRAVFDEVCIILIQNSPGFDIQPIRSAFRMVLRVFNGNHPLYRSCTTYYHDLRHTTDAFLAMTRLAHGALLSGENFDERKIIVALIAALFHDTGYIQDKDDTEGTGAKYTLYHVQRSIEFLKRHGAEHGLTEQEIADGGMMILCTDIKKDMPDSAFSSPTVELLGRLLNAADLMGQMAERVYLEKLLFLFHEYKEGQVGDYETEVELITKTPAFMDYISQRLEPVSERINRYMTAHFASRWRIAANLYQEAIDRQKKYLTKILSIPDADPRERLNRFGLVEKVRAIYGPG
jgi:hypothetical protein